MSNCKASTNLLVHYICLSFLFCRLNAMMTRRGIWIHNEHPHTVDNIPLHRQLSYNNLHNVTITRQDSTPGCSSLKPFKGQEYIQKHILWTTYLQRRRLKPSFYTRWLARSIIQLKYTHVVQLFNRRYRTANLLHNAQIFSSCGRFVFPCRCPGKVRIMDDIMTYWRSLLPD